MVMLFCLPLQRLIVSLEESLYIHNIRDMKVLHTIRDTPPNPHGLCALSINNDNCYLAYPGSSQIGEVQIFDAVNLVRKSSMRMQRCTDSFPGDIVVLKFVLLSLNK